MDILLIRYWIYFDAGGHNRQFFARSARASHKLGRDLMLALSLTQAVPDDWWFLGITAAVALIVFAMDYIIPAMGTSKFGGSRGRDDWN